MQVVLNTGKLGVTYSILEWMEIEFAYKGSNKTFEKPWS